MSRLSTIWNRFTTSEASRAFISGGGVDAFGAQMMFGEPQSYDPNDIASYITTSNAVYTCANYRAKLLASLPIKLYKIGAKGKKTEVETGKLYELLQTVNPFWTIGRWLEMIELSMCLWGESFSFFEGVGAVSGQPKELWWAPSDEVRVIPGKDASAYVDRFEYRPNNRFDPINYPFEETIWLHYPNPLNQFAGLSPILAAAIAADTGRAAQLSNMMIFRNGMNPGGFIMPADDKATITKEQAQSIEEAIGQRFRGADKAHRIAVLRGGLKFEPATMSPKDAEFLASLDWSFEEIARALGVPIDLIGGKSTYNNVNDARIAIWTETMVPEARFIASELTEQLLPLFPGEADLIEFDTSGVSVLQDDEDAKWGRAKDAFLAGAMLLDEYREILGMKALGGALGKGLIIPRGSAYVDTDGELIATASGTGDVLDPALEAGDPTTGPALSPGALPPALPPGKTPKKGEPAAPELDAKGKPVDKTAPRGLGRPRTRAMPFGSAEHVRTLNAAHSRLKPHEEKFGAMTAELMRRQRSSVLAKLNNQRGIVQMREALTDFADDPFDKPQWVKQFRVASRPVLLDVVQDAGQQVRDDLKIKADFSVKDPNVVRFLEQRAQRFATQVNDTTWEMLKSSLADGIDNGESIDDLSARVKDVMGSRIASSGDTIARTEVLGASSGGSLLSAKESGVVSGKTWIAELDQRTRPDHEDAHDTTVALDDDFDVGDDTGPGPGMMGSPENDCNCFPGDVEVYAEDILAGSRREYRGQVVRLHVDDGRILTATPNHPILTDKGWVAANLLKVSDNLIGYRFAEQRAETDPNPFHEPTAFHQVFGLLEILGSSHRMAGSPENFHGDGMKGEIEIVGTYRQLGGELEATVIEPTAQQVLTGSDELAFDLPGDRAKFALIHRTSLSAAGDVCREGEAFALGLTSALHANAHSFGAIPGSDASLSQTVTNDDAINAKLLSEGFFRRPGVVTTNKIIDIEIDSHHGPVYNLHTESGLYLSNGIITHNCRCVLTYELDTGGEGDGEGD